MDLIRRGCLALCLIVFGMGSVMAQSQSVTGSGNAYYGAPYEPNEISTGPYGSIGSAVSAFIAYEVNYPEPGSPYCTFTVTVTPYQSQSAYMYPNGTDPACDVGFVGATEYGYDPGKNLGNGDPYDGDEGGCGCTNAQSNGAPLAADPINTSTGNKYEQEDDYSGSSWLTFRRFYNSHPAVYSTDMGAHWRHSFDRSLDILGAPVTNIVMFRPDGKQITFAKTNEQWASDPGVPEVLTENDNAQGVTTGYTVFIAALHHYETYNSNGQLLTVTDQTGQGITLTYSTASTPTATAPTSGLLLTVTDSEGRQLNFAYNSNANLSQVTLPDGGALIYAYDASANLLSVQYPDGKTRQYVYNESSLTNGANLVSALTGVVDEAGVRYGNTTYDSTGRATSSSLAGNVDNTGITYNSSDGTTTVQYPLGNTATMEFSTSNYGVIQVGAVNQPCGLRCNQPWQTRAYDNNAYPSSYTDFNGNATSTTYSSVGLLTQEIEAQGQPTQRTTTTVWDSVLRVPLSRSVLNASGAPTAQAAWVYNTAGQPLAHCEIDPTVSAAASYTCAATGVVPTGVRRWTYTYCTAVSGSCPLVGLLLSETGPRTDLAQTNTFSYYTTSSTSGCGTPGAACYRAGDLHQMTDALGHTITIASYDADGRITRITDANGVNTDMTYTSRGWLASRTVGGETTSFTYTPYGSVASVTDADGVTITYGYDTAHRLNKVTDALGNYVQYTLDAAGDKTAEQVYDSSGTLHKSLTRTFNSLGQLTSVVDGLKNTVFNAAGSTSYDANGNLIQSSDALGIQRQQGYDALNRLVQTLDNYNGTDAATKNTKAAYSYDSLNRLTQVTDPSSLNTTYSYDGLSDATSQVSPDTGTTSRTFDATGNVLTRTDAKGITATNTYDALDRLISTSYPDTTQHITYTYDEANTVTGCSSSYPIGRLTRIVEVAVTTAYCYDARGNITRKQQITSAGTDSTAYTYTPANRLDGIVYPSGSQVSYAMDTDGRIKSVGLIPAGGAAGTAVSSISYLPFGPVNSYTLGNGQVIVRNYDANYRLTDLTSPAFNLHVARDVMGDITAIGNAPGASPAAETYAYDPLYRLLSVTEAGGNVLESVTYNQAGDRLSKTGSGLDTGTYTYNPNTHKLSDMGTAALSVDVNGNTTAITQAGAIYGLGYSSRNRMAILQVGGSTVGSYIYNALGQRIQKTVSSAIERYNYNQTSQLLGEYGATNRDYIWMGNIPIANVDTTGSTSTIAYVTADELGTPRAIANSSGTTEWQNPYQGNPWNEVAPTSNGYTYNLRAPGQYFDVETGLNYNVNRDYDSATGRYIESDPIGQAGGWSTYAYGLNNPLSYFDPLGLQTNINMFPPNTGDWVGANNYQTPPGIFTVGAHGNPLDVVDANDMPLYPSELANIIKHNKAYKPGEPVRLLSCNTGRDPGKPYSPTSYAQFLANDLGAPVQAPNTFGWFQSDGTFTIAGAQNANGPVQWNQTGINPTNISIDLSAPGTMNTFTPKN